ncbi:Mg2+ transporter protein CorA-like/Zinc transport protein ZntB [Penicillium sp. IBT 35674x]|nr:Mg2+ transporter protein CorA-like/Zinc transport protein ZntB [Penicillium sp. IBT 35674x]
MAGQPSDRVLAWLNQPDNLEPPIEQRQEDLDEQPREAQDDPPVIEERRDYDNNTQETGDVADGIDHNGPLEPDVAPEAIPLPVSGSVSIVSHNSTGRHEDARAGDNGSQNSLGIPPEVQSEPPMPEPEALEPVFPEDIPHVVAASKSLRTKRAENRENRRKRALGRLTYEKMLDNAAKVLDHIRDGSVRRPSRHRRTSITFYDYTEDTISEPRQIFTDNDISVMGHADPIVKQRLILVEDLSKPTIDALGITFSINPEFFEEHLLDSNYAGLRHNEPPARTWKTATFPKSHISFKWIRPVYRQPTYFSHRDLGDLLEGSTEHFTRHGNVTTKVMTNIFRMEWGLWTDPTKTVRMERECGLEEKVSIWKGRLRGRDTEIGKPWTGIQWSYYINTPLVIVLLDPLPVISERHRDWRSKKPEMVTDWGFEHHLVDVTSERSIPESDLIEEGLGGLFLAVPRRVRDGRPISRIWADMIVGRWRKRPDAISISEEDEEETEGVRKVIVKQMAPRKSLNVDLDQMFRSSRPTKDFGTELSATKSTQHGIREALDKFGAPVSFLGPLLDIIRRDTSTLLQHLRQILDELEVDILDDTKMEDRLGLWRHIIHRAQRELPELKDSLDLLYNFCLTVIPQAVSTEPYSELANSIQNYQQLPHDIDQMIERLRATSASLTSNMGLLESRRSIDEAHAVTRLTELAFIFIPLSFATSVFGMQIEPFANPVPIWNFFVVAISVTAFSYLMRMTMRSQWLTRLKAEVKYDVRKYAEKHGQPVQSRSLPMLLIMQWLGNRLGLSMINTVKWTFRQCVWVGKGTWHVFGFTILFVLLIGAVSGIPIAVICTRDLESGIKIPIILFILGTAFCIAGLPFLHSYDPEARDVLPKLLASGVKNTPRWVLVTLLVIGAMGVLVGVPLALIWTRSLATGIKGGLSAGVVIMAVLTMAAFGTLRAFGNRWSPRQRVITRVL